MDRKDENLEALRRRVAELEDWLDQAETIAKGSQALCDRYYSERTAVMRAYDPNEDEYDHENEMTKMVCARILMEGLQSLAEELDFDPEGNLQDVIEEVKSLTAENAELKRQVEALREERSAIPLLNALLRDDESSAGYDVEIFGPTEGQGYAINYRNDNGDVIAEAYAGELAGVIDMLAQTLAEGGDQRAIEALREAAKGEVE